MSVCQNGQEVGKFSEWGSKYDPKEGSKYRQGDESRSKRGRSIGGVSEVTDVCVCVCVFSRSSQPSLRPNKKPISIRC